MSATAASNARGKRVLFRFPDGFGARLILGRCAQISGAASEQAWGTRASDLASIHDNQRPWFYHMLPERMTGEQMAEWVKKVQAGLDGAKDSDAWKKVYDACCNGSFEGTFDEFLDWVSYYVRYLRRLKHGYHFIA